MNNEVIVESKSMRNELVEKVEVLEQVKGLTMLPDDLHVTVEMVANYYEVDKEAINSLIKDHRDELNEDGLQVIKGQDFKSFVMSFKDMANISSKARSITLIPRRAILRIGMLLRDSEVAKQVRSYLLNVEQLTSQDVRDKAFEILVEQNNLLTSEIRLLKDSIPAIITSEINKYLPIRIYRNPSTQFEDLLNKFYLVQDLDIPGGSQKYPKFYRSLEQWIGYKLPEQDELWELGYKGNMKQYLLANKWPIVEEFLDKISTRQIVQSDAGYWVDKNGFRSNDIEYRRVMCEFHYQCAYCGVSGIDLYPDHLIPQSSPESSDMIWNIVPVCKDHNKLKFNQKLSDWYPKQTFYSEEQYNKIVDHYSKYLIG